MRDCTGCGHGARDHGDRAVVACAPEQPAVHTPHTHGPRRPAFARHCGCPGYTTKETP